MAGVDRFERKNYCYFAKVRDLVKLIEKDGWYRVRTKGSHHQYEHPMKPGLVTVPGNPGDDVASDTLNNILKQAGLKP
jgi:predicted RNA binding protein YcfA (HicA-like mRNA interferase family)